MWIRSRTLIYDDEGMKFGINGLKLKKQYTYHESAKYNDAFVESECTFDIKLSFAVVNDIGVVESDINKS